MFDGDEGGCCEHPATSHSGSRGDYAGGGCRGPLPIACHRRIAEAPEPTRIP
jgi:hypothetical protein